MFESKKIAAIIPARGGSKGIPRKNLKPLAGKPLISYTIKAALKSQYLDRVIVSTDDEEIAAVSKQYGAEVLRRPGKLATDKAKVIDVVLQVFEALSREKYQAQVMVLLQPTSPLRSAKEIDEAVEMFLKSKSEFLVSVHQIESPPHWTFALSGGHLMPIFGWRYLKLRKQEVPKMYMPNGAIYISRPETIKRYNGFYSAQTLPYIMPREKSIDIDEEIDLKFAEFLLKKQEHGKS